MKTYYDLQAIDTNLQLSIEIDVIGNPEYTIKINDTVVNATSYQLPLQDPIQVEVIMTNKVYTLEYETAVIIKQIAIDNINIIPTYNHLIDYQNDHNINTKTNYLGYNGKWTLTIDRPFYQWLHQAQNQGWLLD